jgi:hypothetical protein
MGLIAFFAEACARRKNQTANDPPALDFESSNRVGYRRLKPRELTQDAEIADGVSQLGSQGEAVIALSEAFRAKDGSAGAMVRAFEPATGSVRFRR